MEIVPTATIQAISTLTPLQATLPVDTPPLPDELPPQFMPAQKQLAESLGVSSAEITLKSYTATEWSDSCLGVHQPGIACLDVITPGFQVIFDTSSGTVEVHTNQDGSVVRIVPQESGIQGTAMIGPACPGPVQVDNPCPDQPYQGVLILLDAAGNIAAEIQTNQDGSFQVTLPPGNYRITTAPGKMLPAAPAEEIRVDPGQYTIVQISFDSGMR
jgi:hypothetical protein